TLSPIILDPLVDDTAARRKLLDLVRAATEGHFERGLAHRTLFPVLIDALPPMLWQNCQLPDDLREIAIFSSIGCKSDVPVTSFFHLGNLAITGGSLGARFLECVEGKNDVVGRNGLAVMPFCFGTQLKRDR